jgi:hypothetical protein
MCGDLGMLRVIFILSMKKLKDRKLYFVNFQTVFELICVQSSGSLELCYMTPTSYLVISYITQEAGCVVSMTFSLAAFYLSFSCILTLLLKTVKYTHLFSLFLSFFSS